MTDEQILESWNEINKRLGFPPIVECRTIEYSLDGVEVIIEEGSATTKSPALDATNHESQ